MKRLTKVRWYPYPMLGLGMLFFVLAAIELFFYVPPGRSWLTRFATGIYGANHIGASFACSVMLGGLFSAIGIYALRNHKD